MPPWQELSRDEEPEPNQPKFCWQQRATRKLQEQFKDEVVWPALNDSSRALLRSQHGPFTSAPPDLESNRGGRSTFPSSPVQAFCTLPLPFLRTCRCGRCSGLPRGRGPDHERARERQCSTIWTDAAWRLWQMGSPFGMEPNSIDHSGFTGMGPARREPLITSGQLWLMHACSFLSGEGGRDAWWSSQPMSEAGGTKRRPPSCQLWPRLKPLSRLSWVQRHTFADGVGMFCCPCLLAVLVGPSPSLWDWRRHPDSARGAAGCPFCVGALVLVPLPCVASLD